MRITPPVPSALKGFTQVVVVVPIVFRVVKPAKMPLSAINAFKSFTSMGHLSVSNALSPWSAAKNAQVPLLAPPVPMDFSSMGLPVPLA